MTIRVLVADDNALFREGMASLLGRYDGVQVVGLARDAAEAVRKASVLRPDVVLMDLNMPLGGGIQATKQVLAERPHQAICMLTISEQDDDLFAAVRAGARGYLVKHTVTPEELNTALKVLADGGAIVAPRLAARLLGEFIRLDPGVPDGSHELDKLTERERVVVELVAKGSSNREIADSLGLAENTVKVHLRNIMDKLQLRNRQQTAAFAVQQGLVRGPYAVDGSRAASLAGGAKG